MSFNDSQFNRTAELKTLHHITSHHISSTLQIGFDIDENELSLITCLLASLQITVIC
jgi:hypothetical protein